MTRRKNRKATSAFTTFKSSSSRTKTFALYTSSTNQDGLKRTEDSYLAKDHSPTKCQKVHDHTEPHDGEDGGEDAHECCAGEGAEKGNTQVRRIIEVSRVNHLIVSFLDNVSSSNGLRRQHGLDSRLRD